MIIVHLMASPFYGGPEKQMLGLARALPASHRSVFLTFAERGLCQKLLDQVQRHGIEGIALKTNAPNLPAAVSEVAEHLRRLKADVLCCSGYKPDIIGLLAARRVGVPVVAIAHGWTGATWKVHINETLDRFAMRWMDKVVCVSEAQTAKVRRAGVTADRIAVIHNAVGTEAFSPSDPVYRSKLHSFFARPMQYIVGAAGRLSPEKGFDQLVEAAAILKDCADTGFIVFGDGPLREQLRERIAATGLQDRFVLAGFHEDASKYFAYFDALALPSYTEGLPVVLLEAMAVGVPAVATSVGGIPEVVEDGVSGCLVPPGNAAALASKLEALLRNRGAMGARAREVVQQKFSVAIQCRAYQELLDDVVTASSREFECLQPVCHS